MLHLMADAADLQVQPLLAECWVKSLSTGVLWRLAGWIQFGTLPCFSGQTHKVKLMSCALLSSRPD